MLTEAGVCYLTLAEKGYPKKLAYGYLEELQKEFSQLYGAQIEAATRPYAFIRFGAPAASSACGQGLRGLPGLLLGAAGDWHSLSAHHAPVSSGHLQTPSSRRRRSCTWTPARSATCSA